MKFSKKNKIAIILLLGIGIAGFILGFISPRITLLNSEAAGWGKPQANIENMEVQINPYDILFVGWDEGQPSEDLNRLTLKILLNVSNPFEDTGLIIPRVDIELGHLGAPVGRLWTLEEFSLNAFDVKEDKVDTIEDKLDGRNSTESAGLWSVYLSLYTGKASGVNSFIYDLFKGELGTISFNAKLELGNYPLNVEGIFGELLKLVGLGLGGTETGSITDEPIPELLFNALGAELDQVKIAVRSDSILISNKTTASGNVDIRTLLEDENYPILNNETEKIYFGCDNKFNSLYIANATGIENIEVFNSTGNNETEKMDVLNSTFGNNANGSGVYQWEYYNGVSWAPLVLDFDSTANFTFEWVYDWQKGYINFTMPGDWSRTSLCDHLKHNYFYIRVGVKDGDINNLDQAINDTHKLRINSRYTRVDVDIPMSEPVSEKNTVFGDGGIVLDDAKVMVEDEIIVYPGIDPKKLPTIPGLLQYGEGDFDDYLVDVLGIELTDLLGPILNLTYGGDGLLLGLTKIAQTENVDFFPDDFPINEVLDGNIEISRMFLKLFEFLYSHNISAGDLLIYSQLNVMAIVETLAESIPPTEFTTSAKWEGSDFADDPDTLYDWTEQESFKEAKNYSWYIFMVLGAVAILSVPYNKKNKEEQSKFLSGKDIANAEDLMEDDTGKTVLIGSVSSMDNEKMRWELLGGFASIGIGIVLYYLKDLIFPDFNDGLIFSFLPNILDTLFENSRNLNDNPYSPLVIFLTAFVDFPGIFAWFIPALYVSYLRNKQFTNVKRRRVGWDVFWKGAYMIEILLGILSLGLGVATLLNDQVLISYFAGGLLFLVFLFLTPYFYFAIGIAGLGGFIGSRMALKKPGESEVTFTEEYLAEGDDYVGTSDYDEYAEYEEDEYEEYVDTDRTEIVDFDAQGDVVGMVCKYCWETYPVGTDSCGKCGNTDLSQAVECSNCGNMIPIDAKFCNECGAQN